MRRFGLIAVVALALGLGTASAGEARPNAPVRCPLHAHVLKADSDAVIYEKGSPETGEALWGCVRHQSRPHELGERNECEGGGAASGCEGITTVVLAGTMAAYEESSASEFGEEIVGAEHYIDVLDLRTGRVVHNVPTGQLAKRRRGFVGVGAATALVVEPDGSVAWIAHNDERSKPGRGYSEVHVIDQHGSRVLAFGHRIGPTSLRLAGSRLYWTQGGKVSSAPLN